MIGLLDSGSGGLTILGAIQKTLPQNSFVYLGDHGRAPYGVRNKEDILNFTIEMTETLFNKGANLVLLACNTTSAVALRDMQENWLPKNHPDKKVLGVLVPMVEKLTEMPWQKNFPKRNFSLLKNVGVFATPKTIESGSYTIEVKERAPNINIIPQACPGLVEAIEGHENSETMEKMVKGYSRTFSEASYGVEIDAIILGCTHYPLIEHVFKKYLPENITILSQPEIVSQSLKIYLTRHPELDLEIGFNLETLYFTTGHPDRIFSGGNNFTPL